MDRLVAAAAAVVVALLLVAAILLLVAAVLILRATVEVEVVAHRAQTPVHPITAGHPVTTRMAAQEGPAIRVTATREGLTPATAVAIPAKDTRNDRSFD